MIYHPQCSTNLHLCPESPRTSKLPFKLSLSTPGAASPLPYPCFLSYQIAAPVSAPSCRSPNKVQPSPPPPIRAERCTHRRRSSRGRRAPRVCGRCISDQTPRSCRRAAAPAQLRCLEQRRRVCGRRCAVRRGAALVTVSVLRQWVCCALQDPWGLLWTWRRWVCRVLNDPRRVPPSHGIRPSTDFAAAEPGRLYVDPKA